MKEYIHSFECLHERVSTVNLVASTHEREGARTFVAHHDCT